MDLISELPESILHHILHLLPPKEAARTCVLSKTWDFVQSRSPFLRFHVYDLSSPTNLIFYVEKHLERSSRNNNGDVSVISSFTMRFAHCRRNYDDDRIHSILKRVLINGGAQKLDFEKLKYKLPHFVFQSNTLTVLILSRCTFDPLADISLPKLTTFRVSEASGSDQFFEQLILGCPLLVDLNLHCVKVFTTLQVTILEKLQNVSVKYCKHLNRVEILSPNLRSFCYSGYNVSNVTFSPVKKLSLKTARILTCWLQSQLSSCEELSLGNFKFVDDDIHISSLKLSKLKIQGAKMKNVAWIDCPNLQSFVYIDNKLPFRLLCEFKSLSDVRIQFYLRPHWRLYLLLEKEFHKFNSIKDSIKQVATRKDLEDVIILDGFSKFTIFEILDSREDPYSWDSYFISSASNTRQLDKFVKYVYKNIRYSKRSVCVASKDCNNNFSEVLFDKLSRLSEEEANSWQDWTIQFKKLKSHLIKDSISSTFPEAALRNHQSQFSTSTIVSQ